MQQSKFFLMMRKDKRECRAFESKFEKSIGDRINFNGQDYYVFSLQKNLHYAAAEMNVMGFDLMLNHAKDVLPNIFK